MNPPFFWMNRTFIFMSPNIDWLLHWNRPHLGYSCDAGLFTEWMGRLRPTQGKAWLKCLCLFDPINSPSYPWGDTLYSKGVGRVASALVFSEITVLLFSGDILVFWHLIIFLYMVVQIYWFRPRIPANMTIPPFYDLKYILEIK